MKIEENVDITHLTTFGVPVKARWFAEYASEHELLRISRDERFIAGPILNIGGGSNLLFVDDFDGLVLHSCVKGIVRYDKDENMAYVIAGAGEKWSDLVDWTIANGLGGLENMAGIPGDVGAAPVQNVGAYGAEAGDFIYSVECFDTVARKTRRFTAGECRFAYRDSFFKHEGRGRYIVLRVSFRLYPDGRARNLEYGPLRELQDRLGHEPSLREVADEVLRVRGEKLPDPAELGSAGSFFRNPVVHDGRLEEIEVLTGEIISGHKAGEKYTKVSAAMLIDRAGMKGRRLGGARVYDRQPLVIVNDGGATARDVRGLADEVRAAVRSKFLIDLIPEVDYISTDVEVTILGTGTSKGIPEIGCDCHVCTSPYVKDSRTRCSALVRTMGKTILIDPSPDFRQQMLRAGVHHIDAVLITHAHYDHVGGIDDLRPFCAEGTLPVYANGNAAEMLRNNYEYCFREHPYPGVPKIDLHVVGDSPFLISGIKVVPVRVMHGPLPILGYRIGYFAYITDAKSVDEYEMEKIRGLDTLVVNALRERDHFSHFSLDESLAFIEEINPRRAFLTHFNHEIGRHDELSKRLPDRVKPAYDGLSVTVR